VSFFASTTNGLSHRQDAGADLLGQPIPDAHDQGVIGVFPAGSGQGAGKVDLLLARRFSIPAWRASFQAYRAEPFQPYQSF
jgi:hypothetical protein